MLPTLFDEFFPGVLDLVVAPPNGSPGQENWWMKKLTSFYHITSLTLIHKDLGWLKEWL